MNYPHPWQLKKIKILGAVVELPAKQHCQSSPFTSKFGSAIYLDGSSKTAPRILIFSIAMDADNSFYVKFIATYAPTFFWVYYFSLSHGAPGRYTLLITPGDWMERSEIFLFTVPVKD